MCGNVICTVFALCIILELFGKVPTQCTGGDMGCMHMLRVHKCVSLSQDCPLHIHAGLCTCWWCGMYLLQVCRYRSVFPCPRIAKINCPTGVTKLSVLHGICGLSNYWYWPCACAGHVSGSRPHFITLNQ